MRCNKHPADQSCKVGVCASCLREHLLAAQSQSHALKHCRNSDSHFSFPRSVSPYILRRKSGTTAATCHPHAHTLFYNTPQVGLSASVAVGIKNTKKSRFSSLFWGLFKSKSVKTDADPVSVHPVLINSCSTSPAWLPNIISGRRKKNVSTFSTDESSIRTIRHGGKGLSPERITDHEYENWLDGFSGNSSEPQSWRQTPRRTPAATRLGGGRAAALSKSLSGLTLSLSPLVRPSPKRHWNQKQESAALVVPGDVRATMKPHLSSMASFCKNRSRKLVDFGKYPYNPTS